MNKLSKRVLSLLLALLMVLGTCDQALAAGLDNGRYETDSVSKLPQDLPDDTGDDDEGEKTNTNAPPEGEDPPPSTGSDQITPSSDGDDPIDDDKIVTVNVVNQNQTTTVSDVKGNKPTPTSEEKNTYALDDESSYGSMKVKATAEAGVMADGAKLVLEATGDYTEAVKAAFGEGAEIVAAADVSFTDGAKPAEGKSVSLTITYTGETDVAYVYKVFHISDGAAVDMGNVGAAFSTADFSPFGVAAVPREIYTVTFKNGEDTVDTVSVYAGDAIGDELPGGPAKDGYVFKGWFDGETEVTAATKPTASMTANAKYAKLYTVTFKNGDKTFDTATMEENTAIGDKMPASTPTKEYYLFDGWVSGSDKITAATVVTGDMTATATFVPNFYVVRFLEDTDLDGTFERVVTTKQIEKTSGAVVGTVPEAPFIAGEHFKGWFSTTDGAEGTEVTAATVLSRDLDVYAVFEKIDIYTITINYYYSRSATEDVIFDHNVLSIDGSKVPVTVESPASVEVDDESVTYNNAENNIFYPTQQTVTIDEDTLATADEAKNITIGVKYVPFTATYSIVYRLEKLDGSGYDVIERDDDIKGVRYSTVTPEVRSYPYAELVSADPVKLTEETGNVLYVDYARKSYTLTYNSKGGTNVDPVTAPYETLVTLAAGPTKAGYAFTGWFTDEACTQAASSPLKLTENTVLYAGWEGAPVNYTIVYMFEKYDEAGLTTRDAFDSSRTGTANAGDVVYANDSSIPVINTGSRQYWEPDTARNAASSVEVKADGSSVLNVYYKLREYTIKFNGGRCRFGSIFGFDIGTQDVETTLTGYGVNKEKGLLSYKITKVKLGQNIANLWPYQVSGEVHLTIFGFTFDNEPRFTGWKHPDGTTYVTKRLGVTTDMLPSDGSTTITYTAQWEYGTTEYTVNYYLQNADDNGYTKSKEYSQTYETDASNLSPKQIPGYKHVRSTSSGRTYNFYYDRLTYSITYMLGGVEYEDAFKPSVRFEQNISGAEYNWKPADHDESIGWEWGGWYDNNALGGSPYVFDKMPAANLVLYAKWTPPQFTVTFHNNYEGAADVFAQQEVSLNSYPSDPGEPTRDYYTFDGWWTAPVDGDRYVIGAQEIDKPVDLYAHWRMVPLQYTVRYVDTDGNELHAPKTVEGTLLSPGQEVTENAVSVIGYLPDSTSKTLTLGYVAADNVITFVYSERGGENSYTVRYLIKDTEIPVHEPVTKTVDGATSSITEMAAPVDKAYMETHGASAAQLAENYYPEYDSQALTLALNADENVLTFYYNTYETAHITVKYVDMDGNDIPGAPASDEVLKIGEVLTISTELDGYVLYSNTDSQGGSNKTRYSVESAGTIVVTLQYKTNLVIRATDKEKDYDGIALVSGANDYEAQGLLSGDSVSSVTFTGSQTDAGSSKTTPSGAVVTHNGPSGSDYYVISYEAGTLTVKPVEVTILVEPDRYTDNTYNGTEYKAGFCNPTKTNIEDYVSINNAAYKAEHLEAVFGSLFGRELIKETDAGNYTYSANDVRRLFTLPKDGNYTVKLDVREAQLEIKPKELTVTTGSAEKDYDGTALTCDKATVTGFVNGETATITATGSQTAVGSSDNTYKITWGTAKEQNYRIPEANEHLGTLTVNKNDTAITITAPDKEKVYDGTALTLVSDSTSEEYDAPTVTGLPDGFTVKVTYKVVKSVEDATEVEKKYVNNNDAVSVIDTYQIFDAENNDVTANFSNVTKAPGTLTITPRPLTVTMKDDNWVYDGVTHALGDRYIQSIDGLLTIDMISNYVSVNFRDVCENEEYNVLVQTIRDKNTDEERTDNYKITYVKGKITITPAPLTVITGSASKDYDGEPLRGSTAKIEGEEVAAKLNGIVGEDIGKVTVEAIGSITNPGSTPNTEKITWGNVKSTNYNITKELGTLTVNQVNMTLTINKIWDKPASETAPEASFVVTGGAENINASIASGESSTTVTLPVAKPAGEDDPSKPTNTYTYTVSEKPIEGYSSSTTDETTFNVGPNTNKEITFKNTKSNTTYTVEYYFMNDDGRTYPPTPNQTFTRNGVTGETASSTAEDRADKEGGKYVYVVTAGTRDDQPILANGTTVLKLYFKLNTASYTIHHFLKGTTISVAPDQTGTMQIGETLTATAYAPGAEELLDAYKNAKFDSFAPESIVIQPVGSDPNVNRLNVYYVLPLTITVKDQTYTYNGQPQGEDNATYTDPDEIAEKVTVEGLRSEDSLTSITLNGQKTDAGTYTDAIAASNAVAVNSTKVASYYEVTYVAGKLTINKAAADKLGLSVTNYNAPYDGAAHTVSATTTVTEGTTISYSTDGETWSTTAPTWTDVTTAQTVYVKAENPNYETATADGTVTITALAITVNDTATETYDGSTKTLTITADKASGVLSGETLTLTGATISGVNQGEYTDVAAYTWSVAKADGSDSTGNYTITVTGKLTINKAAADKLGLSVTNYNAPYDGAAHTVTATTTVTEGTTISYSTDNTNWSTTAPTWTDVTTAQTVYVKAENPNYETATADGTVTITALAITVNDTATETYDGTTKTLTIAASKATGVLSGETLTLTGATISGVDQGEYTEVAAYTWSVAKADGSDSTGNYTITVTGKLTITRREVTVSVADKTVPYNGSEQSGNTATTFANVVSGQTATIGYTPSKGTLVDTYDNGVYADDFKVVDGDGNDVTANYTLGTQTKGKLTITDEDIPDDKYATKSTGDEDGKKYHIGDTVTWTIEVTNIYNETKTVTVTEAEGMTIVSPDPMPTELAAGEKLVIKVEHVVTLDDVKAGKIENTAKVELGNKLKPEPTDEVETEKIKITVTAASQTKQYDGTALTNGTFTVTPADPEVPVAKGDTVTATVTGSQTQVGSSANTLSNVKVTNTVIEKDAEGKEVEVVTDVTAAYEITTVNGTLTVTAPPPVPYTINYVFTWPGGTAPAGAPTPPAAVTVNSGANYTVSTATYADIPFGIAPNGNVITVLRFQGWDPSGTITNVQSNRTITGAWTIQMVWYTVTYTDGVPGQVIFPDQVTTTLRIGANTPAFNGTPTREGFNFTGWAPAVSPTVTGNNVYTAQWAPIEEERTVEPTPEPTPVVEEEIIDEEVPQAAPAAAWALINLLAALGTVATAVGMIITFFKKKDDDDDGTKANPDEEDENKGKKSKFLGLIPAVASVVIFILTENMHNPMALVDKWTIPMVLILAANGIVAYLTRNKKPEDEDTEKAAG